MIKFNILPAKAGRLPSCDNDGMNISSGAVGYMNGRHYAPLFFSPRKYCNRSGDNHAPDN
ncbi:MAG: hypothetical protein D3906_16200 [Candidatus Electrothrix sp. AUS1_2]|nr:hypothetical protein [Candidatus Electrothrix sp. AUS1_2]